MSSRQIGFDDLALIAAGHTAFQLLWAGIQLGVFDCLAGNQSMSENEIRSKIGLQAHPTRILLDGLTSIGLLIKKGDNYRNPDIVEEILVSSSSTSMAGVLGWQQYIVYPGMANLVESLTSNSNRGLEFLEGGEPTLYERLTHHKNLEAVFQESMRSLSSSANKMLIEAVDFSQYKHLVDAGGGYGQNAIEIAAANPNLKLTVFDSSSACDGARSHIEQAGLSDRVMTHPGNFFVDPFPADIDCVLFAHIMTIWSMEENVQLLRRTYDALPQGGQVLIFNMMSADDRDGPIASALGSPYFLAIATGKGCLYTWAEYEAALEKAGFSKKERKQLPREHGVIVGEKA